MSDILEYCCQCDKPTGKAGVGEGSLFCVNEDCQNEPLCRSCAVLSDDCWCTECATDEITRLTAENKDFKALAREFHNGYITPDVCDTPPDELTALRELMTEAVEITHHHLRGALIGVIAAYDSLYRDGEDADFDDRLRVRWERRVNASIEIARRALAEDKT